MKQVSKLVSTFYEIPKSKPVFEIISEAEQMILNDDENLVVAVESPNGLRGIASIKGDSQVSLFIGNPDGSDDCIISKDEFNQVYKITSIYTELLKVS